MARFWKKRWWWITVGGAVGLAGLFFAGAAIIPKLNLKRQLAAIREAGFPSTPEELNAWYEAVPDEENAALVVKEAAKLHVDHKMMRRLRRNEKGLDPVELEQATEKYLQANRATIEKLHEAAERPRSRYRTDYAKFPDSEVEHLIQMRILSELLRLEAIDQAERGNGAEAMRVLVSGFRLGRTSRNEPDRLAQSVRIRTTKEVLRAVGEVLSKEPLGRPELERLMAILEETEREREGALMRAYAGERVLGMMQFEAVYEELRSLILKTPWAKENLELTRIWLNKEKDRNTFLRLMRQNLDVLTNGFPEVLQASREIDRRYDERLREYLVEGLAGTLRNRVSTAIAHMVRTEGFLRAKLRCARVAVAVEMYRQDEEGRLPEGLEELAPKYLDEVPLNPLDGGPLLYEKTGAGYRIAASIPPEVWDENETPREYEEVRVE